MNWNRKLWGVEYFSKGKSSHLISSTWGGQAGTYPEEPTRALLFNTRRQARAWCKTRNQWSKSRKDRCATWRFRPVRVIETVRKA